MSQKLLQTEPHVDYFCVTNGGGGGGGENTEGFRLSSFSNYEV